MGHITKYIKNNPASHKLAGPFFPQRISETINPFFPVTSLPNADSRVKPHAITLGSLEAGPGKLHLIRIVSSEYWDHTDAIPP